MKLSLIKRLYIGFAAAFILSAAVGIANYLTFKRQSDESEWVRRAYQVMIQSEEIYNQVINMETGRRGFRMTGDKRFLEPYNTALVHIGPAVADLKTYVADNPDELNKATELQDKVDQLIQFWKTESDDPLAYDKNSVNLITAAEKIKVDSVRSLSNQMWLAEQNTLIQKEKVTADAVEFAKWSSVAGTIIIQLIILALIYYIISEFNNRKRIEITLQKNLKEVEKINKESVNNNWLLTGLSNVNNSLQGINDVSELSRLILTTISQYLKIPAAALYVFDSDTQDLNMVASVGLPATANRSFRLKEGVIGTAATTDAITVIKNIPGSYWQVQSGVGRSFPGELMCVPLWYNGELKGIIELAAFTQFEQLQITLLNNLASNLAVAINAADAREKIVLLLDQVQKQKENLQQQEEELRQSNEELIQQAEILQASEEELKVQEEELRQINTELENKNEAIEQARKEIADKANELEITSKYKSEFLANMSHELRTPLNSVLILAKLLGENKQQNLNEKQIEYAHTIHKSGSDLLNLINDILDLSKIEAGKIDLIFEQVSVEGILRDLQMLFRVVADEKSVKFETILDKALPSMLNTDKVRLEQIIKNLLSNAFKFTPKGGTISLAFKLVSPPAYLSNDHLRMATNVIAISVTDTGIGIPPDKQQLIFEAFQQADGSTNRKYGGTGLGLSISKELTKKLGGEMRLQSEANKGSTFTLYLPVEGGAPAIAATEQKETTYKKTAQATNYSQAQVRSVPAMLNVEQQTKLSDDRNSIGDKDKVMLIIEDDASFAGILQDFAREKNYKTIVALQGDEGIFCARKYRPAAIILDMQLPVLNGGQILQLLKSDEALKNIPVHIISASDEAMQNAPGALAYLKKPVEKEKLEKAFSLIGQHLNESIKKVLVLSGDYLTDNSLKRLIDERHFDIDCDYAFTETDAMGKLRTQSYDCLIADIGKDMKTGIQQLHNIKNLTEQKAIPVIIYMDQDLSTDDELQLKKISNIIIRDSSQSKDRLMDELELFLYKVQEEEKAPVPRRQPITTDDKILKEKKILLVDDDIRNIFAINMLLESQDMNVVTAYDGKEALDMLDKHPDIQIVLMDIMMPEMDGYEAIRHIRADKRFTKLPVIALTAKAMVGDREKTIAVGASDYITKPVDSDRLLSLLRVWMSQ